MVLRVDARAKETFWQIILGLREARRDAGLTQDAAAVGLPVRGRAISEWETGANSPSLDHLILWADAVEQRLMITDRGVEKSRLVPQLPRETWVHFERRRLAQPLKLRRAARMKYHELAERIGVTEASVRRWEAVIVPPQPISLVVWAQELGCCLGLRSSERPDAQLRLQLRRYGLPALPDEHRRDRPLPARRVE
ncbi:helix-turn-helix transcriptional regulator [Catenulispora sp. MAP5-51]|uniref:helix-turn-helix transcriptional regulator n=1 Tax=Catenulispora sp. MAP5-51 TaxID=3156298 RepID=UPI00351681A5